MAFSWDQNDLDLLFWLQPITLHLGYSPRSKLMVKFILPWRNWNISERGLLTSTGYPANHSARNLRFTKREISAKFAYGVFSRLKNIIDKFVWDLSLGDPKKFWVVDGKNGFSWENFPVTLVMLSGPTASHDLVAMAVAIFDFSSVWTDSVVWYIF